MKNGNLSALDMPENKKQETVDAVFEAIEILSERVKESRECWTETWKATRRATTHTITMMNHSQRFISISVRLIVGRSQQRNIKHRARQLDVCLKSLQIARETGASFEEVEAKFYSAMNYYVKPKK